MGFGNVACRYCRLPLLSPAFITEDLGRVFLTLPDQRGSGAGRNVLRPAPSLALA